MSKTWGYLEHATSPPRRRAVQWEDQEADTLAAMIWEAHKPWWRFGVQRFERRGTGSSESERQGAKVLRQGYQPGWPDYGLIVPVVPGHHRPTRAYLELKAERNRPARTLPDSWWLELYELRWELKPRGKRREMTPVREVQVNGRWQETVHHVTADQLYWLQFLYYSGHTTCVAYGAEDAFRWLGRQAGPKPAVLPRGWDV